MEIEIIYLLLFSSGLLSIVAGLRGDRTILIPAGGILILLGALLLQSGVEFQTGLEITENVTDNITEITQTNVYNEVTANAFYFRYSFALIIFATALYFILIGATGKKEGR